MSTKFKIGDKVKRSNGETFSNGLLVGTVSRVEVEVRVWIEETGTNIDSICISKIGFTKSDLKDGMRVILRNGNERLVIGDDLWEFELFNSRHAYVIAGWLCEFKDTLEFLRGADYDIMRVVDRDNTVLFERVEAPSKSQQEIEMDKLQKQIAELSAQADKLKASMK